MENMPIRDGTATRPNAGEFDNSPNAMMADFDMRRGRILLRLLERGRMAPSADHGRNCGLSSRKEHGMAWQTTAENFESPAPNNVYSGRRTVEAPVIELPKALEAGKRIKMDGLKFLSLLPGSAIPVAFFDPQYRGVLDKLQYGNEGKSRNKGRSALQQMPEPLIADFVKAIDRVLLPSGHLFLWMDKFHLCQGFESWLESTDLEIVDLVSWNKEKFGMGYRTRRVTEYCVVLQKAPRKAKGVWKLHDIPDTWSERVPGRGHPHRKPVGLQSRLIEAVTNEGDYAIDPAAGSFSVMEAASKVERTFLGCDLNG